MAETKPSWREWLERQRAADLVTLPEALASEPWAPTDADRRAAWILYTEWRTRIISEPLHYRAGTEQAALDSLRTLFDITRETIEAQGPACRHVAAIAIDLINIHLRPLTARSESTSASRCFARIWKPTLC